jgi:aspartate-semialdehyde dehydrogenase
MPSFEHVGVVGATGAVGRELLRIVHDRNFTATRWSLLASGRSAGQEVRLGDLSLPVEPATAERLAGVDLAFFCAGAAVSREMGPGVADAGGVVVDNSSAFRMEPGVPLVVPEVNRDDIKGHAGIIANPNCSTIIMLMAVAPIHRAFPIRRIVVSTYQAASGAGQEAMDELLQQTQVLLAGEEVAAMAFPHPIAFNLFSHDSAIGADGYNAEEHKLVHETRKILHDSDLAVAPTCVRVPVLRAHSETINLEFDQPVTPEAVRAVLESAEGVRVVDDRRAGRFPMPVDASGRDEVLVGRIRSDISRADGRGIELFVCGDQLRKGAALNAVQIAECLG